MEGGGTFQNHSTLDTTQDKKKQKQYDKIK